MKTDRKTKNELRKERRPSEQKKKESENQYNIFESFLCILFIDFTLLGWKAGKIWYLSFLSNCLSYMHANGIEITSMV